MMYRKDTAYKRALTKLATPQGGFRRHGQTRLGRSKPSRARALKQEEQGRISTRPFNAMYRCLRKPRRLCQRGFGSCALCQTARRLLSPIRKPSRRLGNRGALTPQRMRVRRLRRGVEHPGNARMQRLQGKALLQRASQLECCFWGGRPGKCPDFQERRVRGEEELADAPGAASIRLCRLHRQYGDWQPEALGW